MAHDERQHQAVIATDLPRLLERQGPESGCHAFTCMRRRARHASA